MSQESLDKAKRIKNQIIETLRTPPDEGPEPRYLLVEEAYLRITLQVLEKAIKARDFKVIQESLLDMKSDFEEIIKEADSLTLEEKETLMEELVKRRKANAQSKN